MCSLHLLANVNSTIYQNHKVVIYEYIHPLMFKHVVLRNATVTLQRTVSNLFTASSSLFVLEKQAVRLQLTVGKLIVVLFNTAYVILASN